MKNNFSRIVDSMGTDLLEKMTPEERMQGLTVSERVQGLSISERVQGLTISERLVGLHLEDLQTLDPEMKVALLQLLNQSDSTQE